MRGRRVRGEGGVRAGGDLQRPTQGHVPRGAHPVRHDLLRRRPWPVGDEEPSQGDGPRP